MATLFVPRPSAGRLLAVAVGCTPIGPASLARENEAGGSWGQEVNILHVNI